MLCSLLTSFEFAGDPYRSRMSVGGRQMSVWVCMDVWVNGCVWVCKDVYGCVWMWVCMGVEKIVVVAVIVTRVVGFYFLVGFTTGSSFLSRIKCSCEPFYLFDVSSEVLSYARNIRGAFKQDLFTSGTCEHM